MSRKRLLTTVAVLSAIPLSAGAAQPETWSVVCLGSYGSSSAKYWPNTTAPNVTNGAFQFTLFDGTEVRTTAGMNCYATRNPPKAS